MRPMSKRCIQGWDEVYHTSVSKSHITRTPFKRRIWRRRLQQSLGSLPFCTWAIEIKMVKWYKQAYFVYKNKPLIFDAFATLACNSAIFFRASNNTASSAALFASTLSISRSSRPGSAISSDPTEVPCFFLVWIALVFFLRGELNERTANASMAPSGWNLEKITKHKFLVIKI